MSDKPYMTQEGLRDFWHELTGSRATPALIRSCILAGLPYVTIGKRKLYCRESVLEWLKKRETQNPTYARVNKDRR